MTALANMSARMSVAEFLAWSALTEGRWQLVDGEPQAMAPPASTHGALQSEVARLIGNHLPERGSPCRVVTEAGIVPHVQAGHNLRSPDLAVSCAPVTGETASLDDPVPVIEILSPGNQAQTRSNVRACTSIPGVSEILVLRTTAIGAERLRRRPDGSWPERPAELTGGTLTLASIGLSLPLAAFWRTTHLALRPLSSA